jgi:endonuclease YncB( thermonuclease family)
VAVRDVTPPGVTALPPQAAPPVRVAPPPRPPSPPRVQRLYSPVIIAAGKIRAGKRAIGLAGVDAPDFAERCGAGAAAWPCGRMARAALRRFVRGRAMECEIPKGATEIPDPARCKVAGQDLSQWLVAQGWARSAGDAYATAEEAARALKLGLWGERRPDSQPAAALVAGAPASSPARALAISDRVSPTP